MELDRRTDPADTLESEPSTAPPLNSTAMMVVCKPVETVHSYGAFTVHPGGSDLGRIKRSRQS